MNTKKNNLFKTALFILLILLGVTAVSLNAQDKKVKEKIKDIKGEAKKITIVTDKESYTFEADEAGYILGLVKDSKDGKKFDIYVSGDDEDAKYVFFSSDDDDCEKVKIKKIDKDFVRSVAKDDESKTIKVEVRDGKKKVTVTTDEDGKEVVKEYEGEEADEYLKNNNNYVVVDVISTDDIESKNLIWNFTTDENSKVVKVEEKDGVKKVTITTTKDGEEKTEVYEGKEADEQLKLLKKDGVIDVCEDGMIYIYSDDDCKEKDGKVYTIKIKEGDSKKTKKIYIEKEEKKEKK